MSEVSFPGPGQTASSRRPCGPARDEAAARGRAPEDDWDGDAEMAAYIADLDAGRARIPEEWEIEGPAATISLGDAAGVGRLTDNQVLGAMSAARRLAARAAWLELDHAIRAHLRRPGLPSTRCYPGHSARGT